MGAKGQGIKIKINCDIRGAEKAMERLDSQMAKLQKAERKVGHINSNYQQLGAEARKAYAEAEKALKKYQNAEAKAERRSSFVRQKAIVKDPNATEADIDAAVVNDGTFVNLSASAGEAHARYIELTAQAERLSQKHERLAGTLQKARQELASERGAMNALQAEVNRTDFVLDRFKGVFSEIGRRIGATFQAGADKAKGAIASLPKAVAGVVKNAASAFSSGMKKMGSAAVGLAKNVAKTSARLLVFHRTTQKSGGAVQGFSNAIIKLGTMLKMLVIRQAMRAMVKAAKEGFENLAQYSTECNANMSALMSSMTQLKNSFAAAFSPILSVVTPALSAFISKLVEAVSCVGALFAALSGSKTFTKAAAVTEDYAASLEDADSAAKNGKKAFSFDNLNQLQGSAGGGGYSGPTPTEMFEEVDVPTWISGLVDLIKGQDWDGVGEYIAGAINRGMMTLKDLISWDNAGGAISGFVSGLTSTINSLVSNISWETIGATFGTGVNTLVNTLYLLFTGINWYNLGASIATGLNSMILTIDWYHLGKTMAAWLNIAINTALGFVQTFNWASAGQKLATALNGMILSINWAGLGSLISGLLAGALIFIFTAIGTFDWAGAVAKLSEAVFGFVGGVDWGALGQIMSTNLITAIQGLTQGIAAVDWATLTLNLWTAFKDWFTNVDWGGLAGSLAELIGAMLGATVATVITLVSEIFSDLWSVIKENFTENGKFTWEGFKEGLLNAITGIATWINDHIFQPFINGFKNAFGIHSPSTVMAEMGGYIIEGLKNGLSGLWDGVKGFFTGAIDGIKETFSLDTLKTIGSNAVTGMVNGLKSIGTKATEWGSGILGNIRNALGIHSPSTETEEVGEYTVAGYINGLNRQSPLLMSALGRITDGVIELLMTTAKNLFNAQTNAQSDATVSLTAWMTLVKSMFTNFYTDLTVMANTWASNLQERLNSMVAAAQAAAREIASAMSSSASVSSGASRSGSSSRASSSTGGARAISARAQGVTLNVPAYATGKVLPANNPHLAIVGDQRKGTNIETQITTMMEAMRRVMREGDGGGSNRPLELNLYLDTGVRLGRAFLPSIKEAVASSSVTMTARG